jgi:hypothetical protein
MLRGAYPESEPSPASIKVADLRDEPLEFAILVRVPKGAQPGSTLRIPVRAWYQRHWEQMPATARPANAYPIDGFGYVVYGPDPAPDSG